MLTICAERGDNMYRRDWVAVRVEESTTVRAIDFLLADRSTGGSCLPMWRRTSNNGKRLPPFL